MGKRTKSVLAKLFGSSPFLDILDTLMDHPARSYTKKELAEVNDISRATVYNNWDRLEELNLVEPTRKVGNVQLFQLNHDSPIVKELYELEHDLMEDEEANEILELA